MPRRKDPAVEARKKQLADWVRDGLRKPGKQGNILAQILGIHEPTISKIIKGQRSVHEVEIPKIAEYIEEPVPPIEGEAGDGNEGSRVVEVAEPLAYARPTVLIAPFVWREEGVEIQGVELVPLSMDKRLDGITQYVAKSETDDTYYICIPFKEWRQKPIEGDRVHVRRFSGRTYEDTVRLVQNVSGMVKLVIEDKPNGALTYPPLDNEYEIRGLVVGRHTQFRY